MNESQLQQFFNQQMVSLGLGRIFALYCRRSTLHQIHEHTRRHLRGDDRGTANATRAAGLAAPQRDAGQPVPADSHQPGERCERSGRAGVFVVPAAFSADHGVR
jgi:hypothetical protein